ncbi:DUF3275 family protein [Salmonella enterica subsp. enterica]|uniref:DUF3275 family protein n=1 Tax=Salmonella enterica subsp. enterica serovar Kintambo TaxID=1192730 RepID=A0A5W7RWZ8_SALET|nr:DUF3275 family protein [Salmonella enterica subsp. enterica serovar Kintambo]EBZ5774455.1 DUF3275 family protein [Salmonella enterica subsp. enterica serovar Redlands]ECE6153277.1 hypothetical protein [Salmonella enterica subsp. enterica]ECJ4522097.1 hypothetical protein [Salmonella enterica subsp. enterica]ECQ6566256.1 DUF3275 family protein [Salmonella enterica subsp. enterica serovar Kintambo]
MNTSTNSPVIVNGKLVVRTINGRNGAFNVGLLETAIGSFSVKDRELEQYSAGTYEGQFVIGKVFMHSWSYGANSGSEIRVRLDAMNIASNNALTPDDERKLLPPVNDPLEEEIPAIPETKHPTPAKAENAPKTKSTKRPQFTVPTPAEQESDDQTLFGTLWPLGDIVKLDATAPRQTLRQQKARLSQLGYDFIAQEQHFVKNEAPEEPVH